MKKLLLASTALVLSAGVAAAEVRVGGDGRMGIVSGFGTDDIAFTSRIRISFSASGQTDGGLTFGGSIRADNAGTNGTAGAGGVNGAAGSVFISGAFGRLTMGDVSGAPEAAVGDVSGVGLTGLGDLNEATYLSNGARPAMRYDYTTGAFGFHISADNPIASDTLGVAVTYNAGAYKFGLGYEDNGSTDHIVAGGSASFGDATVKAFYGTASGALSGDQYGLSIDYKIDALTLTAFYVDKDTDLGDTGYGLGAAYSLGGGATLRGGYARNDTDGEDSFDFGIALTF
jgi:outer membrane protein OmpU